VAERFRKNDFKLLNCTSHKKAGTSITKNKHPIPNIQRLLWLATKGLAETVCQKVRYNLTKDEWHEFVGADIPYQRTCPNLPYPFKGSGFWVLGSVESNQR